MAEHKYYTPDMLAAEVNLAATDVFTDEQLTKLGSDVVQDYDIDERSRTGYMKEYRSWLDLANQVKKVKSSPWPNASNVKYPLLVEGAIQYNARAYPALINSHRPVQAMVLGEDHDGEKAKSGVRVSKHMSWQLGYQMKEWESDFDQMLLVKSVLGCMFKKIYRSGRKQRNYSEVVYPEHMVVNYKTRWEDAERKTHVKEYTKSAITSSVRAGIFLAVELGDPTIEPSKDGKKSSGGGQVTDTTPYIFLEQHRLLDLDNDGIKEPYIVTVEKNSKKVLRVVANYEVEGIVYNDQEQVISIEEEEMWVKYTFIPSLDGSPYDLGLGRLIGPLSKNIDTNINQLNDAGTLSNMGGGFLGRGSRLKAGDNRFKPGEWKNLPSSGEDIKKNVFPLPIREPSSVLFSLLNLLIRQAQRIAGTVDSMVGENPGQNQKATTTVETMKEGRKVANAIHKRSFRSLQQEFSILYRLNARNPDIKGYFTVLDTRESEEIYATDYNTESHDVLPAADPNISSAEERIAKAQAAVELAQNGLANMEVARTMYIDALELPNRDQLLQMPKPKPSLEEMEFEHKRAMEIEDRRIKRLEAQLAIIEADREDSLAQAKVIELIAKAEGVEPGQQMQAYKMILDDIFRNRQEDNKELAQLQELFFEEEDEPKEGEGGEKAKEVE